MENNKTIIEIINRHIPERQNDDILFIDGNVGLKKEIGRTASKKIPIFVI
jgi:hypothetical protein